MNISDEIRKYQLIIEAKDTSIKELKESDYGQEAILDIHDVPKEFYHDKNIRQFAEKLCDEIGMTRGPIYLWGDDKALGTMNDAKADGISVIQFLHSSSITIHAIDTLNKVFINVFSCKTFDGEVVKKFAEENIGGRIVSYHDFKRI